ncbi:MAG: M14 family metallocarboxypeptidase [Thalassotalea sp.]|nr:M14 family metallocarboxypeptidase [Thalassotalea sp.]
MSTYPIGTPGQKWGKAEKAEWLAKQVVKRSYRDEVLAKVEKLREKLDVERYASLSYDTERYPLMVIKTKHWHSDKPTALVTGGIHGYETSGVQGAIRFAETKMEFYSDKFNVIVVPCVSPWGYETINRWNPNAVDPNRSFYAGSLAEESLSLMKLIESLSTELLVHIDLHETTDTDNSEFRPALAARDGVVNTNWNIPDGFYLVGDSENPQPDFQQAMIEAVAKVTHIAPPDESGNIIGAPLEQHGVINYAYKPLGLCAGLSNAKYTTTTEVYPDSPKSDDENCILAQVAAITSGLDFVIADNFL